MTKGQRIRNKRESLQISQTDLAKKVGISKQTLYKYENDIVTNIPSDIIEKLSECLDCSPEYIMGWEKKPTQEELNEAIKLFHLYKQSKPQVRNAIDLLLTDHESDP